jgi:hypothetical protein
MRRVIAPLSVLLALQLALALLLVVRRDPLAGGKLDTPLLQATVKDTDQLIIESKETMPGGADAAAAESATPAANVQAPTARIELSRKDGKWILPGQFDAPADAGRVNSLLDRLGALKRGLPVATSEASLRRFKVADNDFERRVELRAAGKTLDTLYLGTSPGLRKSDARTGADRAVYAVDLLAYELPTDPGSWLNAELLSADVDELTELDVATAPADRLQLLKQKGADGQASTWTGPSLPGDTHIDNAHADLLVRQLSQMRVDAVLGTTPKPEWQQDHPALRLELKDDKNTTVDWTLSKASSGDYYVLKSSAHPWFFSVGASQAKSMIDAAARNQLIAVGKAEAKPPGKSTG